jgi:hypothetical protein
MSFAETTARWLDRWDRFEAMLGLMACFALTFGPLAIAGLTLIFALLLAEWPVAAVAAAITAVTCPMAVWLARMAESALAQIRLGNSQAAESSRGPIPSDRFECQIRAPFAIVLVSTLPRIPRLARVPLGVWWLAHFFAGTALIAFADVLVRQGIVWKGLANGLTGVAFAYAFHVAANVFLLLAVTATFQSPKATARVWRMRFLIDGLCILPLVIWTF